MIISKNKYLIYTFIIVIISCCSSNNSWKENKIIRDKMYFVKYEYITIWRLLKYINFDNIDQKGECVKDLFDINV